MKSIQPNKHMKYLITAVALCLGLSNVQAQTTPEPSPATKPAAAPAHAAHNCMTATDKDWTSLGLTAEQTTKVQSIQAECMKACGAMMKSDPKMGKMMDKHEADVKAVLTTGQYDSWMKWCAAQADASGSTPMEKKPMEK